MSGDDIYLYLINQGHHYIIQMKDILENIKFNTTRHILPIEILDIIVMLHDYQRTKNIMVYYSGTT